MPYLFLFHIGPVQSFIASARRTRDLWFGSQLLSDLSWTAAASIAESYDPSALIFPFFSAGELRLQATERNVSNKIVALLEPKESCAAFAATVKLAVEQRLGSITNKLYHDMQGIDFKRDVMDEQLKDCLEFFWVVLPFPYEGDSNYSNVRRLLEAQMAARKATYTYQPVTWGSTHHKSSITGTLESVIPQEIYAKPEKQRAKELFDNFRAGPTEHLSGIDLLKRRGEFPEKAFARAFFLSTSHIAAQPFLDRLEQLSKASEQSLKDAWKKYHAYIEHYLPTLEHERFRREAAARPHTILGRADGALLFEEHLTEHANKDTAILQQALKLFADFKKEVNRVAAQKSSAAGNEDLIQNLEIDPYYAIVVADGDEIGKAIDTLARRDGGPQSHQRFSQRLALFAGKAKQIVRDHRGTPIYTGGDDVLALVPLHKLLDCTNELAKAFKEALEPAFKKALEPVLEDMKVPTLSMGVVIVHHLSLLQESLELARRAERLAKGVKGKNALAILISKRGGEQSIIRGPREKVNVALEQYIEYYRAGVIPYGLAYELRTMYQQLLPIEQRLSDELKEVIWSNAKRIIKRKMELPGSKVRQASTSQRKSDEEKKMQDALAKEILLTLLSPIEGRPAQDRLFENVTIDSHEKLIPLPEFINELLIARELAEARQLAEGTKITLTPKTVEGMNA
ncbi:type III-B CRISPR-associated protein Cas10/Cmr2 [Dictyobacter formicarum]|uniref:Type III-B CRISPR-associated protein Cas10/Cmr2 n=1 Tax=Dictyobacter formicarum TaxID=2778368 RepID=A0ABQ3VT19_9CHLR|nr:type III-B CRISPR-associated protein Cas10/Cmr2 [Dictyobacter formicarum]GHO89427.1 type III-B CRISPR-associated protein Cas10/Cmr2 [Dictyobacter formicarum]